MAESIHTVKREEIRKKFMIKSNGKKGESKVMERVAESNKRMTESNGSCGN